MRKHRIRPELLSKYADMLESSWSSVLSSERAVMRMSRYSEHEEFLACFYDTQYLGEQPWPPQSDACRYLLASS